LYNEAAKMAKPGIREFEIAGRLEGITLEAGTHLSFPPIITVRGETLHNTPSETILKKGNMLLIDIGVESANHYSSDITRTIPVDKKFSTIQKEIYQTVIEMQQAAIDAIKPGVQYLDVHIKAAKTMVKNLKSIGFLKKDSDDVVLSGAYALFFPHGLGHMLGLDVHDMEDLGENYVGYDETVKRSNLFGLGYLRLAKKLEPGFVLTVEPGIYFIPALIEQWKQQGKYKEYINYDKVEAYINFGGIRIEDDVIVTNDGCKILSKNILYK
jgi:Xaa-Pro aminopeptidase